MKPFQEQLRRLGREMKLTDAERVDMRARIREYMDHLPLEHTLHRSYASRYFEAPLRFMVSGFVVLFVVVTGGVSFAAEGTYPGDFLYPVKVYFNEEVQSSLHFSTDKIVSWGTERFERRLNEVAVLALRGVSDTETYNIALNELMRQTNALDETLNSFESSQPILVAQARTELQTSLGAYHDLVSRTRFAQHDALDVEYHDTVLREFSEAGGRLSVGLDEYAATQNRRIPTEAPSQVSVASDTRSSEASEVMSMKMELSLPVEEDASALAEPLLETYPDLTLVIDKKFLQVAKLISKLQGKGVLSDEMFRNVKERLDKISKHINYTEEGVASSQRDTLASLVRLEVYLRSLGGVGERSLIEVPLDEFVPQE